MQVSIEDVIDRQNRLAKMRSLLFRHEMKAKHIKNIKSKTYHRILKKERQKASSAEINVDPEAAKELAIKQEFKRAEVHGILTYFHAYDITLILVKFQCSLVFIAWYL